ncbi:hypothetical protein H7F33_08930 [Pedobacter sp. PAMC26386]|nr:hypothetical protein H7F33_08930 [Pedobacter sp. PAMC26386]
MDIEKTDLDHQFEQLIEKQDIGGLLAFIKTLSPALSVIAQKNPLIYLTWFYNLLEVVESRRYNLSIEYITETRIKLLDFVEHLQDYQTDDLQVLNLLGLAFDMIISYHEGIFSIEEKLHYYELALHCFTKGQKLDPTRVKFTRDATNMLKSMATLYHTQQNMAKVTERFELGRVIFSKAYENEKNFDINFYWGHFLIEYARLTDVSMAKEVLKDAERKLLLAKELIDDKYQWPYLSLANIALMSGDKDKCLNILKEYKSVISPTFYKEIIDDLLTNEDFIEVRYDLSILIN